VLPNVTMAAATENTLSKVDSLVEESPKKEEPKKRRGSSLHADVFNMTDLGELLRSRCNGVSGVRNEAMWG
jgi:hypothetical protein